LKEEPQNKFLVENKIGHISFRKPHLKQAFQPQNLGHITFGKHEMQSKLPLASTSPNNISPKTKMKQLQLALSQKIDHN
jgi:hypothetical protein